MTAPKRISIKFFANNPEVIQIEEFTAILQRWIQDRALEGLLIDVVDYKHMYEGPGIILIGDLEDYGMDSRDGRLGLMLTIKRHDKESLEDLLQHVFPLVLKATTLLEADEAAHGLTFDYSEAKIEFLDRLKYPNSPETMAAVEPVLSTFLATVYPEAPALTSVHEDKRENFAVGVQAAGTVTGEQLLQKVASPVTDG